MVDKTEALIFAPTPPQPPGGIGSIVAILHQSIVHGNSVSFFSPIAKGSGLFTWITRPVLNIFRLYRAAGNVKKGGRVLFFSSSGVSFCEKILWVLIVILRGRRSSMVMVDG